MPTVAMLIREELKREKLKKGEQYGIYKIKTTNI